ncbi:MAG: serine hydrolase [Bacteroidales bacterium]|nr:serine hydrolase [Bacteroidales bacterium]
MKDLWLKIIFVLLGLTFILPFVNPGFRVPGSALNEKELSPPFIKADSARVDSLMQLMSLEEKIGQMIMVPGYSNRGEDHIESIEKAIRKHHIGGVIFFKGDPGSQAAMINRLQAYSEMPLLIAMDAEWGLGMRLENTISYPRQMMLGALQDDQLVYELGQHIAMQLKDLGVYMNFAPVADINNNPDNPVINTRSFGEDRKNVSRKVNAYFRGMQDQGILVTAKHFPGHGDTDTDSHLALPVIRYDRSRLDSIELYPFKKAINEGITGIMVAHLNVPSIDAADNIPTSLSGKAINELLLKELNFKGLVVTDALKMKGVSDYFKSGDLEVEAVKAGADILLMPENVGKAISHIKREIRRGSISEQRIDHSCRKILLAKSWVGLDTLPEVDMNNLDERLHSRKYLDLQHRIAKQAITLVKDPGQILPIMDLTSMRLATINIGVDGSTDFTAFLDKYRTGHHYYFSDTSEFPADSLFEKELLQYNTLIVSLYYTRSFGNNFGIPEGVSEFVNSLQFTGDLVVNLFGYPYSLGELGPLENADAIMVSYTDELLNQQYAAQGIFGGISLKGRLPVSVGHVFPAGTGADTKGEIRLQYGCPETVGMNFDTLKKIDQIIRYAIREKAMPGCQVLVARNGNVIWEKSYGYHTYRNRQPVRNTDLYDLASITKIAATIPALMRLMDQGRFSIDSVLGDYMAELDTSEKAGLQIRDILTHQAGFEPWIPFYTSTIETLDTSQALFSNNFSYTYPYKIGPAAYANRNIVHKDSVYDVKYSEDYPLQVAKDLYLRADYRDSIYLHILRSPLGEKQYKYSDLGYYYFYRIIEEITDTLLYPYSWYNFYGSLGAETLGFLPLNRFDAKRIVPTENDLIFRHQLVRGYVHDPGAAMLGGICGHAGLFSSANDLAKMMQMFLNRGEYGGKRYIDSATIAEFTRCQFCDFENRRALGFDRPITEEEDAGPACNSASELSYGHSGFTGTITWMDPKYDLLYVFLSNRVHPDQYNNRLISMDVRTDIQQVIYDAMLPASDSIQ